MTVMKQHRDMGIYVGDFNLMNLTRRDVDHTHVKAQ